MKMNPEQQYGCITIGLCGAVSLVLIAGIAGAEIRSARPQPTATPDYSTGTLVLPLSPGLEFPTPEPAPLVEKAHHDESEGPVLEVVATWGDVYKVQKMETGQYKIIEPEPQLFDIKFLRPEDIATIR